MTMESGIVIAVDLLTRTATIDVGAVGYDGNPVHLLGVPFSGNIPRVGERVAVSRVRDEAKNASEN